MSLQLVIEEKGAEQASQLLVGLARRGEDPRPAFKTILDELRMAEDVWFRSHGKGDWPALAPETLARKRELGQPSDILVATGALGRSLTVRRGAKSVRSATKTRMRFGSQVWYGKFHKLGSGNSPVRDPLLPLDLRTRRRMVKDVQDYMMGRLRRTSV